MDPDGRVRGVQMSGDNRVDYEDFNEMREGLIEDEVTMVCGVGNDEMTLQRLEGVLEM